MIERTILCFEQYDFNTLLEDEKEVKLIRVLSKIDNKPNALTDEVEAVDED
ncbi:MAG: hypothetical protein GY751_11575 [Bacteroidetes bacterium]|nr:hypothetical protein [Bacteroidota bacterium]